MTTTRPLSVTSGAKAAVGSFCLCLAAALAPMAAHSAQIAGGQIGALTKSAGPDEAASAAKQSGHGPKIDAAHKRAAPSSAPAASGTPKRQ